MHGEFRSTHYKNYIKYTVLKSRALNLQTGCALKNLSYATTLISVLILHYIFTNQDGLCIAHY